MDSFGSTSVFALMRARLSAADDGKLFGTLVGALGVPAALSLGAVSIILLSTGCSLRFSPLRCARGRLAGSKANSVLLSLLSALGVILLLAFGVALASAVRPALLGAGALTVLPAGLLAVYGACVLRHRRFLAFPSYPARALALGAGAGDGAWRTFRSTAASPLLALGAAVLLARLFELAVVLDGTVALIGGSLRYSYSFFASSWFFLSANMAAVVMVVHLMLGGRAPPHLQPKPLFALGVQWRRARLSLPAHAFAPVALPAGADAGASGDEPDEGESASVSSAGDGDAPGSSSVAGSSAVRAALAALRAGRPPRVQPASLSTRTLLREAPMAAAFVDGALDSDPFLAQLREGAAAGGAPQPGAGIAARLVDSLESDEGYEAVYSREAGAGRVCCGRVSGRACAAGSWYLLSLLILAAFCVTNWVLAAPDAAVSAASAVSAADTGGRHLGFVVAASVLLVDLSALALVGSGLLTTPGGVCFALMACRAALIVFGTRWWLLGLSTAYALMGSFIAHAALQQRFAAHAAVEAGLLSPLQFVGHAASSALRATIAASKHALGGGRTASRCCASPGATVARAFRWLLGRVASPAGLLLLLTATFGVFVAALAGAQADAGNTSFASKLPSDTAPTLQGAVPQHAFAVGALCVVVLGALSNITLRLWQRGKGVWSAGGWVWAVCTCLSFAGCGIGLHAVTASWIILASFVFLPPGVVSALAWWGQWQRDDFAFCVSCRRAKASAGSDGTGKRVGRDVAMAIPFSFSLLMLVAWALMVSLRVPPSYLGWAISGCLLVVLTTAIGLHHWFGTLTFSWWQVLFGVTSFALVCAVHGGLLAALYSGAGSASSEAFMRSALPVVLSWLAYPALVLLAALVYRAADQGWRISRSSAIAAGCAHGWLTAVLIAAVAVYAADSASVGVAAGVLGTFLALSCVGAFAAAFFANGRAMTTGLWRACFAAGGVLLAGGLALGVYEAVTHSSGLRCFVWLSVAFWAILVCVFAAGLAGFDAQGGLRPSLLTATATLPPRIDDMLVLAAAAESELPPPFVPGAAPDGDGAGAPAGAVASSGGGAGASLAAVGGGARPAESFSVFTGNRTVSAAPPKPRLVLSAPYLLPALRFTPGKAQPAPSLSLPLLLLSLLLAFLWGLLAIVFIAPPAAGIVVCSLSLLTGAIVLVQASSLHASEAAGALRVLTSVELALTLEEGDGGAAPGTSPDLQQYLRRREGRMRALDAIADAAALVLQGAQGPRVAASGGLAGPTPKPTPPPPSAFFRTLPSALMHRRALSLATQAWATRARGAGSSPSAGKGLGDDAPAVPHEALEDADARVAYGFALDAAPTAGEALRALGCGASSPVAPPRAGQVQPLSVVVAEGGGEQPRDPDSLLREAVALREEALQQSSREQHALARFSWHVSLSAEAAEAVQSGKWAVFLEWCAQERARVTAYGAPFLSGYAAFLPDSTAAKAARAAALSRGEPIPSRAALHSRTTLLAWWRTTFSDCALVDAVRGLAAAERDFNAAAEAAAADEARRRRRDAEAMRARQRAEAALHGVVSGDPIKDLVRRPGDRRVVFEKARPDAASAAAASAAIGAAGEGPVVIEVAAEAAHPKASVAGSPDPSAKRSGEAAGAGLPQRKVLSGAPDVPALKAAGGKRPSVGSVVIRVVPDADDQCLGSAGPGTLGILEEDDKSDRPFLVMCGNYSAWYEEGDIRLATRAEQTAFPKPRVGARVKRGPSWFAGAADGGSGKLGTIVTAPEGAEPSDLWVQWDHDESTVMGVRFRPTKGQIDVQAADGDLPMAADETAADEGGDGAAGGSADGADASGGASGSDGEVPCPFAVGDRVVAASGAPEYRCLGPLSSGYVGVVEQVDRSEPRLRVTCRSVSSWYETAQLRKTDKALTAAPPLAVGDRVKAAGAAEDYQCLGKVGCGKVGEITAVDAHEPVYRVKCGESLSWYKQADVEKTEEPLRAEEEKAPGGGTAAGKPAKLDAAGSGPSPAPAGGGSPGGGGAAAAAGGGGISTDRDPAVHAARVLAKVQELRAAAKASGKPYSDPEYGKGKALGDKKSEYDWARAPDFAFDKAKGVPVVSDGFEPADIQQGELGDCWLLSSFSVLATQPRYLEQVILTKEYDPHGVYAVRLWRDGKWREVILDDFFPVAKDGYVSVEKGGKPTLYSGDWRSPPDPGEVKMASPAFVHCTDARRPELWALLLEKAMSKYFGSYPSIEGGTCVEGLCTFVPHSMGEYIRLADDAQKAEARSGSLFSKMRAAAQAGHLLGAGSPDGSDRNISSLGVVQGHAYSVLRVEEVSDGNGTHQLLQLRNPWGRTEWTGKFSDTDKKSWTARLKSLLSYDPEKSGDDGAFWISIADFIANFSDVYLCKVYRPVSEGGTWYHYAVEAEWKAPNMAGGCCSSDNAKTWMKNPQFFLPIRSAATVSITVTQLGLGRSDDEGPKKLCLGWELLNKGGQRATKFGGQSERVIEPPYSWGSCSHEGSVPGADKPYTLLVTTFNPGDVGRFLVTVASSAPLDAAFLDGSALRLIP